MTADSQYVILEWVRCLPGFPRYSFATIQHAKELCSQVRWLQQCPSLELAAETASQLNFRTRPALDGISVTLDRPQPLPTGVETGSISRREIDC